MPSLHEAFDSLQGFVMLGGIIFFIYDRLQLAKTLQTEIKDLGICVKDLSREVGKLSNNLATLEGEFSVYRQLK